MSRIGQLLKFITNKLPDWFFILIFIILFVLMSGGFDLLKNLMHKPLPVTEANNMHSELLRPCLSAAQSNYFRDFKQISEQYDAHQITLGQFNNSSAIIDDRETQASNDCYIKYDEEYQKIMKINEQVNNQYKPY